MAKIALVPGHNKASKGKITEYIWPRDEYSWASGICMTMADRLQHIGHSVRIFTRDPAKGKYRAQMQDVAKRINEWEADFVYEQHFNGFHDPSANGCEALHWHTSIKGKAAALRLMQATAASIGVRPREALGQEYKERGYGLLKYAKAVAVLNEPFFGSNEDDCRKWEANADRWMDATAECIDEICREVLQL